MRGNGVNPVPCRRLIFHPTGYTLTISRKTIAWTTLYHDDNEESYNPATIGISRLIHEVVGRFPPGELETPFLLETKFRAPTPVRPADVAEILRLFGTEWHPDLRVSCHSIRIGVATEGHLIGASPEQLRMAGGWTSDAFYKYIRPNFHRLAAQAKSIRRQRQGTAD